MICKMCSAGGAVNLAAYDLQKRDPNNLSLMGLLQQAEGLHEMCYDHNCGCQHKANVVKGIDWNKVKGVSPLGLLVKGEENAKDTTEKD